MTEQPMSGWHPNNLEHRAVAAVSSLRRKAGGAAVPDLAHLALVRRVTIAAVIGGLAVVAVFVALLSALASAAVPWVVGLGLASAVVGVIVLGIHAGGHGLLVPLPVLALAGIWALMVFSGNWSSAGAWVLAAIAFASAAAAAALVLPALAYRHVQGTAVGGAALIGATGVTVGPLSPAGIVRVKNETWTAESLSGPLPAGAPVHVARVEGVHLLVWSESGVVPGAGSAGSSNQTKEEA
ncbi:MAG TPA: NfeD family protein [Acidimicrobiales bacterium]|nr:NfeD family protein [Acidimicrobiales bacterium]